jgi:nucleoside-triphosphatase THEP1
MLQVCSCLETEGVTVLGTIPVTGRTPIVEVENLRARPDVAVLCLTPTNRDEVSAALVKHLIQGATCLHLWI